MSYSRVFLHVRLEEKRPGTVRTLDDVFLVSVLARQMAMEIRTGGEAPRTLGTIVREDAHVLRLDVHTQITLIGERSRALGARKSIWIKLENKQHKITQVRKVIYKNLQHKACQAMKVVSETIGVLGHDSGYTKAILGRGRKWCFKKNEVSMHLLYINQLHIPQCWGLKTVPQ